MSENRAARYVDQLEAHMDAGGGTAPNNVRDLMEMVRSQVAEITVLREVLSEIRDGYGPNHGSKYCRDTAAKALAVQPSGDK